MSGSPEAPTQTLIFQTKAFLHMLTVGRKGNRNDRKIPGPVRRSKLLALAAFLRFIFWKAGGREDIVSSKKEQFSRFRQFAIHPTKSEAKKVESNDDNPIDNKHRQPLLGKKLFNSGPIGIVE